MLKGTDSDIEKYPTFYVWLSGSLKRIDYPKQICLAHTPGFLLNVFTALKGTIFLFYLLSLQLVLCRVAALKNGPVNRPQCSLYFTFGPLRSAEIF